jgi:hypothetical protein
MIVSMTRTALLLTVALSSLVVFAPSASAVEDVKPVLGGLGKQTAPGKPPFVPDDGHNDHGHGKGRDQDHAAMPVTPDINTGTPQAEVLTPQQEDTPDLTSLNLTPEEIAGLSPEEAVLLAAQQQMKDELANLDKIRAGIPTLFFTQDEHRELQSLLASIDVDRSLDSLTSALPTAQIDGFAGARELSLGGIFYKGGGDWIVWLNNQRLTPDRLPKELQDIKVYKNYVEIKWRDQNGGKVHAVRLRPNQRYNMDSRSFAPG